MISGITVGRRLFLVAVFLSCCEARVEGAEGAAEEDDGVGWWRKPGRAEMGRAETAADIGDSAVNCEDEVFNGNEVFLSFFLFFFYTLL